VSSAAGVSPGEVRVGLAEAELGEPLHAFRSVNASARKITSGCSRFTSSISQLQNENGLVCGLSTRNVTYAVADPVEHDRRGRPSRGSRGRRHRSYSGTMSWYFFGGFSVSTGFVPSGRTTNQLGVLHPGMIR